MYQRQTYSQILSHVHVVHLSIQIVFPLNKLWKE